MSTRMIEQKQEEGKYSALTIFSFNIPLHRRSKSNRLLGNEEVPFSPENQEDDLFDPQSLEKDPLIIRFKRKRGHSSEDETQNAPRKSSRLTSEGYGYFESPVDPSPIAPRRGRPPRTVPVVELVDSSPEKIMIPLRGRGRPAKNSKRSKEEDEDEDDGDDGSSAFSANSDGDEDADSDDQEEEDDDDDDDNDDNSDDRPRRSSRKRKSTTAAKRGGRKKKQKKTAPKAKTSSSRVTRGRGRRSHQESDEDEDDEEDELPSSPEVVQKQTRRTSARSQRYTEEADEVESVDRGRPSNTRRSTRQRRSINYDEEDDGQSGAVQPQQGEDEDEDEEEEEEEEEVPQSRRGRTIKPPSNILKEIYEKEKEEKEERQRQKQKQERQSSKQPVSSSSSQLHNLELSTTRKRIDPETKHTLQLIIQKAEELDGDYQFFALPVDPSVAIGYYQIIQQPMDLSTIRSVLYSTS